GLLKIPVRELVPGRAGLSGLTADEKADPDNLIPKFKNGTFNIIRAGGNAGKYSAIIPSIGGAGRLVPANGADKEQMRETFSSTPRPRRRRQFNRALPVHRPSRGKPSGCSTLPKCVATNSSTVSMNC